MKELRNNPMTNNPKETLEEKSDRILQHTPQNCADCRLLGKSRCKYEDIKRLLLSTKAEAREEAEKREASVGEKYYEKGYHAALDSKYGEKMHARIIGAASKLARQSALEEISKIVAGMKLTERRAVLFGDREAGTYEEKQLANAVLDEVLSALSKKEI